VNRVLTVTEYQSIKRGQVFSSIQRTVTASQFLQLEQFIERFEQQRKVKVFQHGPRNSLIAQNFVGVIHLGSFQVEVLPKVHADESQLRRNLVEMVAGTLKLKLHGGVAGQMERSSHSVLEALARLYCESLWQALHKGMVKRYETRRDNLVVLRGRLNVAQQLRHNLARPDRLHCSFDEFTPDNELNRVLKLSLRILLSRVKTEQTTRNVAELLMCFDEVGDISAYSLKWERVVIDRLSEGYAPLVRMARMFIEGYTPDLVSGKSDGFAVLFDMNELFEEFIGRQVQRVTSLSGVRTLLQSPVLPLARLVYGKTCFQLRPDIVLMDGSVPTVVLDTKWKRLKAGASYDGLSTVDIYQMHAYAQRYSVRNVVLLYPHYPELGPWQPLRNTYSFLPSNDAVGAQLMSVATVDLENLKTVPGQLQLILERTNQLGVTTEAKL